jgi:hypothetical protein
METLVIMALLRPAQRIWVMASLFVYIAWLTTWEWQTVKREGPWYNSYDVSLPDWSSPWNALWFSLICLSIVAAPYAALSAQIDRMTTPFGSTVLAWINHANAIGRARAGIPAPAPASAPATQYRVVYETTATETTPPAAAPSDSPLIIVRDAHRVRREEKTSSGVPIRDSRTANPDTR